MTLRALTLVFHMEQEKDNGRDDTSKLRPSSLTCFLNANSSFCVSRSSSMVCFCILPASFSSSSSELSNVRIKGFGSNVFEFSLMRVAMIPLDSFSIKVFELNVPYDRQRRIIVSVSALPAWSSFFFLLVRCLHGRGEPSRCT